MRKQDIDNALANEMRFADDDRRAEIASLLYDDVVALASIQYKRNSYGYDHAELQSHLYICIYDKSSVYDISVGVDYFIWLQNTFRGYLQQIRLYTERSDLIHVPISRKGVEVSVMSLDAPIGGDEGGGSVSDLVGAEDASMSSYEDMEHFQHVYQAMLERFPKNHADIARMLAEGSRMTSGSERSTMSKIRTWAREYHNSIIDSNQRQSKSFFKKDNV